MVEQHVELAMDVTSGNPERLVGVIMDNTKANLSALKQLQERWLCLGCFAHGLALLIKDLAGLNEKHTYFILCNCVYIIYLYRHIIINRRSGITSHTSHGHKTGTRSMQPVRSVPLGGPVVS